MAIGYVRTSIAILQLDPHGWQTLKHYRDNFTRFKFENMESENEGEIETKKLRYSDNQSTETSPQKMDRSFLVTTAKDLIKEEKFLSTGCKSIDATLKGGFPNRGITQIYGAAGTGKTQFALQLCLTVQLPISHGGFEAGAVYISTEGTFPSRRLQDLLSQSDLARRFDITGDAIFVETLTEIPELEICITQRLPRLLAHRKIGLLVLDSIAAPYRAEYSGNEMKTRAKNLWNIAHQLHALASQYKLTVVCINQVSAAISPNSRDAFYTTEQPTLGITWANMITNNFYLCKKGTNRYLYVMQSSYLPRSTIEYAITSSGVSGIVKT